MVGETRSAISFAFLSLRCLSLISCRNGYEWLMNYGRGASQPEGDIAVVTASALRCLASLGEGSMGKSSQDARTDNTLQEQEWRTG